MTAPEEANLEGRNGEIWRAYYRGEKQGDIAARYGITQARVSQICAQVRASIEPQERAELLKSELDLLSDMRREVLTLLFDMGGAPVTAGKDGDIVRDPETGEVVRDHTGRLNAARVALSISERIAKAAGLDAAQKLEVNAGEEEAARAAAAQAAAHLHGGGTSDDG